MTEKPNRPLRAIAKHAWMVRDLGERVSLNAGTYISYFNVENDAFENHAKHEGTPRTGAIAVIGFLASEKLGLRWRVQQSKATAKNLRGDPLAEVWKVGEEYRVKVLVDAPSVQLHLAALHGLTILRQGEPAKRRKGK